MGEKLMCVRGCVRGCISVVLIERESGENVKECAANQRHMRYILNLFDAIIKV